MTKERKDFVNVKSVGGLVARITSRYEYVFHPGAEPLEVPRALFESWTEEMRAQLEASDVIVKDRGKKRDQNPSTGSRSSRLRGDEEK